MRLFRRKSEAPQELKDEMVQWLNKLWLPLHGKFPSHRDDQATASLAAWSWGEVGMSMLIATTDDAARGPELRDRWQRLNPGEDYDAWLEATAESAATYLDEHPEAMNSIREVAGMPPLPTGRPVFSTDKPVLPPPP
jgi:hypothetical protein